MIAYLNTAEGVATVIIAGYVACIGTVQWFTAREKLRLDLYNRRFEVYASTMDYMQTVMVWKLVSEGKRVEQREAFIRAMFESDFLFEDNPRIQSLLDEFNNRSFAMVYFHQRYGEPKALQLPDFGQNHKEYESNVQWILNARESLKTMLTPYLAFRNRTVGHRLRLWFHRKSK
ncbi:MAG: hypothetical protein ACLQM6_08245 [Acidobacteriaceae bacterium]